MRVLKCSLNAPPGHRHCRRGVSLAVDSPARAAVAAPCGGLNNEKDTPKLHKNFQTARVFLKKMQNFLIISASRGATRGIDKGSAAPQDWDAALSCCVTLCRMNGLSQAQILLSENTINLPNN